MSRFSFRGRFRSRYKEFEKSETQPPVAQVGTLPAESHLFDIAEAHFDSLEFGTARIFCWPSPEGVDTGRRWGRYRSVDAVILPFRTKASLSEDNATLNTYELELFLCSGEPESSASLSFSMPCPVGRSGEPCNVHSEICLVELPAPESMVGLPTDLPPNDVMLQKPWKLRSEVGCSCGNSHRAAKWIWDAKGHDPIALHGSLALKHAGRPFLIACRVNGQALVQHPNRRLSSILKFGNGKNQLKWFRVEPKTSNADLSIGIEQLQDEMRRLNTRPTTNPSSDAGPRMDNLQGHTFGTTIVNGHATVYQGSVSIGNNLDRRLPITGGQQYNPAVPTLELPQVMEG